MEYPFKDLLPLDEVLEREGYYKDWTHLDPEVFYSLTQISEYIKTKGFGVDVRLLIAQLAEHFSLKTSQINEIERLFKDVIKELSEDKDFYSLPEIAGARGGFDTLGDRLNDTTAQLAQKIDKTVFNVANQTIEFYADNVMIDSISVSEAGNAQAVQDYIDSLVANGQIDGVTLADGSVDESKIKNNLNPSILDNVIFQHNLLNKATFIERSGLDAQGNVSSVPSNSLSDYIPVLPETKYYRLTTNAIVVGYYNSNKDFISRPAIQSDVTEFTTPKDAYYLRVTNTTTRMQNEVISITPQTKYIPYGEDKYTLGEKFQLSPNTVGTDTLKNGSINRLKLEDNFLSVEGYLDDTYDLDTISKDGIYVVTSAQNKPSQLSGTLFLRVETYKLNWGKPRWVLQYASSFDNPAVIVTRKVDLDDPNETTEWEKLVKDNQSQSHTSKFTGKKWVLLGDSITYGSGASSRLTTSYSAILASKYGALIENEGINGATWQKDGSSYDDISILAQIANTTFEGVDYVTIFAGTNDWGRNTLPIGAVDDMVENTLHGAINLSIQNILASNPSVRIALITPMWRQRQSAGDDLDSDLHDKNGVYLRDYVDAIVESAKHNHVPVLNLYDTIMINKYNHTSLLADGLHPNDLGHDLIADKIHAFMSSVY